MKNKFLAIFTIVAALCSFGCSSNNNDDDAKWETIKQAYTYAFPLVIMEETKVVSTNIETPDLKGHAPINQLNHSQNLANASTKSVVTPNVDTVYSQAWLDLGEEPMVFVKPKADRYFTVQVLDAWTNTADFLEESGTYAFVPYHWQGDLPVEVKPVYVPTDMVWLLGRVILDGASDLDNVKAIQKQMKLLPLSAYVKGGDYNPPKGTYSEDNVFVPVEKALAMDIKTFFDKANLLMEQNPPLEQDEALLPEFAKLNIGPGLTFDKTMIPGDIALRWAEMQKALSLELADSAKKYSTSLGSWVFYGEPIGDFGTAYSYRAMVAIHALGANTVDAAIYPKNSTDSQNQELSGENTYILHFDSLPLVKDGGFWSVTAYGSDDFLIDNPIDRYCINDRSDYDLNADGSLDIVLSKEQPDNVNNWLPVSDDNFHLYMRMYKPEIDKLPTWTAPTVTKQ